MTLLIINRRPLIEQIPVWLSDLDHPLVLLTARSAATPRTLEHARPRYREIIVVDDYDDPSVEALIVQTARRVGATRILSATEVDVLRTARAREQLSLPGQTPSSAMAFRDKLLMKTLAADAGIIVAPMQRLDSPTNLRRFCDRHGLPVVVKPVRGGGSVGTRVLYEHADVNDFLRSVGPELDDGDSERRWMAEAWVDGTFFTIDGLMSAGSVVQIWPSRTTANLLAVQGPSPLLSGMLTPHDPLALRIRSVVNKVIASLPATEELTAFHAEVFHTPDDRIVFCEIACRPGGCGHVPVYEHALGVNLYAASLRGQAGCTEVPMDLTTSPRCMAGFAWFPPRTGVLEQMPLRCPLPGVFRYETRTKVGTRHVGARSVADHIARAFISGPVDEDLQPKLEALDAWWGKKCAWDQEDGHT